MARQTLQPDTTRQASAQAGALPVSGQIWNNLCGLARSKTLWGVLLLAVLWGYGYAMNTPAVDMDDLAIATYQQGGEFLRQGRITVWLLQALTGIMTYQRFWPELFFALSLVLAGILLAAVLYTAARRQAKQPGAQLLAAGLLGVKLPRSGRGLLGLIAGCAVFFLLGMNDYPPLRVGVLAAGMFFCLYLLMAAVKAGYEGAGLMLLPCAVTTGFRIWALLPGLDSPFFVESAPFYLLRCARLYDLPFAIGCMVFVCRRFALLFDRTEQLARELDARVAERTKELTAETEARKSMMLNIFHDLRSPLFAVSGGLETLESAPEALPALLPALRQRIEFLRRLTEDLFLAAKLEQKQILLNEDRAALN